MGGLIPVGQGADAEIKQKLNKTFGGRNLIVLQNNYGTENFFDHKHHLHRVAYRLGCYPIDHYSGENSRGKWFYFLKNTLTTATYNGNTTSDVIKAQLAYALNPANNITGVVFEAIEITSNNDHYIYPNNDPAGYQITTDASGAAHTLSILLVCPAPLDSTLISSTPDQAGDMDPGEAHIPL